MILSGLPHAGFFLIAFLTPPLFLESFPTCCLTKLFGNPISAARTDPHPSPPIITFRWVSQSPSMHQNPFFKTVSLVATPLSSSDLFFFLNPSTPNPTPQRPSCCRIDYTPPLSLFPFLVFKQHHNPWPSIVGVFVSSRSLFRTIDNNFPPTPLFFLLIRFASRSEGEEVVSEPLFYSHFPDYMQIFFQSPIGSVSFGLEGACIS